MRLRELGQLFNTMDPAPFHEKELDRAAEEYILGSAKELPKEAPLALVVYLDQPAGLPDEGMVLENAVRAHFARRSKGSRRRLRELLLQGRISLAIGLVCLAASLIGSELIAGLVDQSSLTTVLRESLVIGGWVAMWRPLETFLYDWWPILGTRRVYDRLSRVAVHIVYTRGGEPGATGVATASAARR